MKKYVRPTLEQAAQPKVDLSDEQLLYSYAKKVLDSNPITQIPTWIKELPIPHNTVASSLNGFVCYNNLLAMRKKMPSLNHPVYTIDSLLALSEVKIEKCSLVYKEEGQVKVLSNTRGYFLPESENNTLIMAAAYVADVVPYYTRYDPNTSSATPSLPDKEVQMLVLKNVNTVEERSTYSFECKNESCARDIIYKRMMEAPDLCMLNITNIVNQNSKFAKIHKNATLFYHKYIKENNLKVTKIPVNFPNVANFSIPRFPRGDLAIEKMYDYLLRSRSFRGNDKGIGTLTFGYIMGSMPRAVLKYITFYLDLQQLLRKYNVNVVMISGKISEMVIRMLVHNGVFVISLTCGITNVLTQEKYDERVYGVYSSIECDVQYGIYYEVESKCASMKNKIIMYETVDVEGVFKMTYGARDNVAFKALRAHISPNFKGNFGYLPCAMAHNGQVIVTYPKICDFKLEDLALRTTEANFLRNNFLVLRYLWITWDKCAKDCGYFDSYIIPAIKRRARNNAYDYSSDLVDVDVLDTPVPELPLSQFKTEEKKEIDPAVVEKVFYDEIAKVGDISDYVKTLILYWETNSLPMAAKAFKKAFPKLTVFLVCENMKVKLPEDVQDIECGIRAASDEIKRREAKERKNKEIKQPDTPSDSDEEVKEGDQDGGLEEKDKPSKDPNFENEFDYSSLPSDDDTKVLPE